MSKRLEIKKLGPITEAVIQPRPLTVIIGPQASGKSLIAQCLYFFDELRTLLARDYSTEWAEKDGWQEESIRSIIDGLRGVPIGYFANGTASLKYIQPTKRLPLELRINIHETNRRVRPLKKTKTIMSKWLRRWEKDKAFLNFSQIPRAIYIPTERSLFTRFADKRAGLLYDSSHPEIFRMFADVLSSAKVNYRSLYYKKDSILGDSEAGQIFMFLRESQRRALSGEAYIPKSGPKAWKWRVQNGKKASNPKQAKIIPIKAIASGQSEAWPFYVLASTHGAYHKNFGFYFEEPETHLHPAAQVEIMNAIAYLVNRGRKFVITTHSPFLLYVINNMIMRYEANKSNQASMDSDIQSLDPEMIEAYRMVDGQAVPILDRDDTNLISEEELEWVASDLGGEFSELLSLLD